MTAMTHCGKGFYNPIFDKNNMEKWVFTICLFWLTIAAQSLLGQATSDSLQYSSSLTIGGSYKTGLLNQLNLSGVLVNSLQKSNWLLYNRTSYFYGQVNKVQLFDNWTVVSKVSYSFIKRAKIYPTIFHLYKSNLLYRIINSHRVFVGSGISPLDNKNALLYVGAGFDNTLYAGEQFVNSDLVNSNRRFGVSVIHFENKHHLADKRLSFSYSLFYFQSFKEATDYNIWIIPSLQFALHKTLSLAINYDLRYRNVHLVDLPAISQDLTVNLNISFQN